ncbi:MAG: hypothetical protein GEV03_04970 [Streptosporangiales bacterium]|nr:hypothetical protein [Streptosporangiales bacterium]
MRLLDLLHPYLDGVHTVIEVSTDEFDLAGYLHLPEGVSHRRRHPAEAAADEVFGAGVLVLAVLGPALGPDQGAEPCRRVIERMRPGGRGLILFGDQAAEMPYHLVLDDLVAAGCQVLQAATLDYVHLRSGIAFAAVEEVVPPRDHFGRPTVAGEEPWTLLRMANEYVLADLVARGMRARLADLEPFAPRGAGTAEAREEDEEGRAASEAATVAAARQERQRLKAALAEREAQLRRAESRLAAIEGSTKLRIGQVFVNAGRRPVRGAVTLPRELYRLWRRRGAGSAARRPAEPGTAGRAAGHGPFLGAEPVVGAEERLLLRHTAASLGPRDRLVVAGVLREETCAALAPDAVVDPMLPHDALLVLERTEPDVVLIEAAAAQACGPWAYLGNLVAVDRDRRLAELISAAHVLGCPVVLWRNAPASGAPGLSRFEELPPSRGFDAVVDGDLGVQLAQMGPVALDPGRSREPVYVGPRDPREPPAVRRLLDEVLAGRYSDAGVRVLEPVTLRQRVEAHRGRAVFLASRRPQVLEQLAAGGRVVAASDRLLGDDLLPHATAVADAEHAVKELHAAAEAGPRDPTEVRAALRQLFRAHATPVRLGEMARRLGLAVDPLAGRRVAVLAEITDAGRADRFVDAVLGQAHRPAEAVVRAPADLGRAWDELTATGVPVRVADRGSLRDLAAAARSRWAMPWSADRDYPETYLLDLVCAGECSRADVVGHADDGGDYVFAPSLRPALIRRDLLADLPADEPAEAWARRGSQLFAIR